MRSGVLVFEDPCVLGATALRGVNYQRTFFQGHTGQSAGHHLYRFAAQHIRPQVDVAWRDTTLDKGRATRQAQRRLRNISVRVGAHSAGEVFNFSFGGGWPDQHAVATRPVYLLDHQIFQVGQGVVQVVFVAAHVGWHVVQNRLLTQVELDHLGHIRIDRLVIGHTGANRVADSHVGRAVGVHQPGTAKRGVLAEHFGVQKVVVHAPVNHVHAFGATGGAHVHKLVLHKQVLPLHQFHTHLLGQKRVFEVGAVVHAGREHHHGRFGGRRRAGRAQGLQQQIRVMRDRRDPVRAEKVGKQPHHHLAVFQHVANAAGHPQVVFKHVVHALTLRVRCPHDVYPRNMRIHVARYVDAHHLGTELRVVHHLVGRNQSGLDDLLAVIHIVDKAVQRRDPLHQAFFEIGPFMRRDDARDQVKRNQAFVPGTVFVFGTINRKRDADAPKDQFGFFAPLGHHVARLARQPFVIYFVVLPYLFAAREKLVRHGGVHLVELMHEYLAPVQSLASFTPRGKAVSAR